MPITKLVSDNIILEKRLPCRVGQIVQPIEMLCNGQDPISVPSHDIAITGGIDRPLRRIVGCICCRGLQIARHLELGTGLDRPNLKIHAHTPVADIEDRIAAGHVELPYVRIDPERPAANDARTERKLPKWRVVAQCPQAIPPGRKIALQSRTTIEVRRVGSRIGQLPTWTNLVARQELAR